MSDPSDSGESEAGRFDREPFDAERVADDPVGAFADNGPESASATDGSDATDGTTLADAEVDTELRVLFWKLVLLYKMTIIGATLGALLFVFDQGPDIGVELLAGSLVLLVYTLYATKRGKKRIDAGEFDSDSGPGGEPGGETGDPPGVSDTQGGEA